MIFGQTHEERRRRATQLNEWRLWFAWSQGATQYRASQVEGDRQS
jgi:hypothetical protein